MVQTLKTIRVHYEQLNANKYYDIVIENSCKDTVTKTSSRISRKPEQHNIYLKNWSCK